VLHVPGLDREHLAAGDAIVGTEAEPRSEVRAGRERGQVGAQLGEDRMTVGSGVRYLREIGAEDAIELGAKIEAGGAGVLRGVRPGPCGGGSGDTAGSIWDANVPRCVRTSASHAPISCW